MTLDRNQNTANAQAQIRRDVAEQNVVLKDLIEWEDDMRKLEKRKDTVPKSKLRLHSTTSPHDNSKNTSSTFKGPEALKDKSSMVIGNQLPTPLKPVATAPPSATIIPYEQYSRVGFSKEEGETERQRGNTLYASGDFDAAIQSYSKCIQIDPGSVAAHSNRAMAYLKIKDWNKAEIDATSTINIDPLHWKAYQRRSVARSSLGKIRASLKDLQTAKRILESKEEKDSSTAATLKKIDADLEQVRLALLEAARKAPKKMIPIQVIAHKQETKNEPKEQVLALNSECKKDPTISITPPNDIHKTISKIRTVRSWLDFEQIWKSLSECDKPTCLQNLRPQTLTKIYCNGIEDSDLLVDLISNCVKIDSTQGKKLVQALCTIPTIDMVVMMMSSSEKKIIAQNIKDLSGSPEEACDILKKFGL